MSRQDLGVAAALAAMVLVAAVLAPAPAWPSELDAIQALADRGRTAEALRRLEGRLAGEPNHLDGQLLRGTLLAELGRSDEAERAFRLLESQYPGQPEPTHNLAVMRAWARQPATAIRALEAIVDEYPTYETAVSNLERIRDGASRAAFDPLRSDATRLRLALTPRQRFSAGAAAAAPAPAIEAPAIATLQPIGRPRPEATPAAPTELPPMEPAPQAPAADPPVAAPTPEAPVAAPPPPPDPQVEPLAPPIEPAVEPAPEATPRPVAASPAAGPTAVAAPAGGDLRAEIEAVVAAWAAAWSEQRIKEYLAFYAAGFEPGGHPSRAAWEAARRQRVAAPSFVEVEIDYASMTVERAGPGEASASFGQSYRSDRYSDSVRKTLDLVRENGVWRIKREASQ